MIALIQRVKQAAVRVEGKTISRINNGICVFLGVKTGDTLADIDYLCRRIESLKFFKDTTGKFVHNLKNYPAEKGSKPEILVVSQFTLYADLKRGTRPSFTKAMEPVSAENLYEDFCTRLRRLGYTVNTGKFGAYMEVELINDGPVTFSLSSDQPPLKNPDNT